MTQWTARVTRHLHQRGLVLPEAVIEELATHLEDAWEARSGDDGDVEAFVSRTMQRADLTALARQKPSHRSTVEAAPAPGTAGVLSGLPGECRLVWRGLRRAPVFTAAVVTVLALGIGATTAAFALVYATMLGPLPYADADRLVMVWEQNIPRNRPRNVINTGNYFSWSERSQTLEASGLFTPTVGNLSGDGATPEEVPAMAVQASVLSMTGVRPVAGRLLTAADEDPAAPRALLIDEGLWRRRFGGAGDTIGRAVVFNGEPATVVGVLPARFHVAGFTGSVWRPALVTPEARTNFRGRSLLALARLKPGISRDAAQSELAGLFATLVPEHPEFNTGWTLNVVPVRDQIGASTHPALLTLFAAVAAVLLVACANVAALLLVRASSRHHEMAVRVTLGARPVHLVRQLVLETATLVGAGGLLGGALAVALTRAVWATAHQAGMVVDAEAQLGAGPLAFAVALTAVTAVVCGVGPAWRTRRTSRDGLREGGRGVAAPPRGRGWLVAGEVATATLVLAGAALLVQSYLALQDVDPGFNASHVLTARVSRMGAAAQDSSNAFAAGVLTRLRALPGVTAAGATSFLPLDGQLGIGSSFRLADRPAPAPGQAPVADYRPITPGYFATLQIPVRAGRDFTDADVTDRPRVAIVNEAFVRQLSPDISPLGRRLDDSLGTSQEIVGVVADIRLSALGDDARPAIYLPYAQQPIGALTFVARTIQEPASLGRAVAAAVRDVDPNQPVSDIQALDDVVAASLTRPRVASTALGLFAAAALLLAAIGVYGVVAYGVQLRRGEFGVRLALGAEPHDVVWLVVRQSMRLVGGGVLAGAALAVPLSGALRSLLFGVAPGDPLTLAAVAAVMVGAGFLASYVPARRGTRVDPVTALRAE